MNRYRNAKSELPSDYLEDSDSLSLQGYPQTYIFKSSFQPNHETFHNFDNKEHNNKVKNNVQPESYIFKYSRRTFENKVVTFKIPDAEIPETYVFKRRVPDTSDMTGSRFIAVNPITDAYSDESDRKHRTPPETYNLRRLRNFSLNDDDANDYVYKPKADKLETYMFQLRRRKEQTRKGSVAVKGDEVRPPSPDNRKEIHAPFECECLSYLRYGVCDGHPRAVPYRNVRHGDDNELGHTAMEYQHGLGCFHVKAELDVWTEYPMRPGGGDTYRVPARQYANLTKEYPPGISFITS